MKDTCTRNKELIRILGLQGTYEILSELEKGEKRFSELKRLVTHSTLAKRLRELERLKLVSRKILNTRPPIVLYSLTPKGKEIISFLKRISKDNN